MKPFARGAQARRGSSRACGRRTASLPALLMSMTLALGGCTAPSSQDDPAADSPSAAASSPSPSVSAAAPTPQANASSSPSAPPAPTQSPPSAASLSDAELSEFAVPSGDRPHDVAPAPDGRVWYTAQRAGALGLLDPATGEVQRIPLGQGAAPHGVIVGPDEAAWVTDGGLNAIVRVDPTTFEVEVFALPGRGGANLNTAAFDAAGVLWFTGQAGVYGRLDPASGALDVFDAPRGTGPYGIAATPDGDVWFSSLAGSYIARIDSADGSLDVVDVPSAGGGARRVWSDSAGRLWVTQWFAGSLARYDPADGSWAEWPLPGEAPQPYAVYVDADGIVWVTDFGGDALVAFDPATEEFLAFSYPTAGADVRQLLGGPGEVWGAGSGTDTIIVLRTG